VYIAILFLRNTVADVAGPIGSQFIPDYLKTSAMRYHMERDFQPKMHQKHFASRAPPGPTGDSQSTQHPVTGFGEELRGQGMDKKEGRRGRNEWRE